MSVGQSPVAKICSVCGGHIPTPIRIRNYCSINCQAKGSRQRRLERSPQYIESVSTGTVGAIHELAVAVDLMKRGLHVFRALSPACPCDLLVMTASGIIQVEVRTARRKASGELTCQAFGIYDVLALITHDGAIEYRPDIFNL